MKKIYLTLGLTLLLTIAYISLARAAVSEAIKAAAPTAVAPAPQTPAAAAPTLTRQTVDGEYYLLTVDQNQKRASIEFINRNGRLHPVDDKDLTFNLDGTTDPIEQSKKVAGEILKKAKEQAEKDKTQAPKKISAAVKMCKEDESGDVIEGDARVSCLQDKIEAALKKAEDKSLSADDRKKAGKDADNYIASLMKDDSLNPEARIKFADEHIDKFLGSTKAVDREHGSQLLKLVHDNYIRDIMSGATEANSPFVKYLSEIIRSRPSDDASFAAKVKYNSAIFTQTNATFARFESLHGQIQDLVTQAHNKAMMGDIQGANRDYDLLTKAGGLAAQYKEAGQWTLKNSQNFQTVLADVPGYNKTDLINASPNYQKIISQTAAIQASINSGITGIAQNLNKDIAYYAKNAGKTNQGSAVNDPYAFTLGNSIVTSNSAVAASAASTISCVDSSANLSSDTFTDIRSARMSRRARGCNNSNQFIGIQPPVTQTGLFNPNAAATVSPLTSGAISGTGRGVGKPI